MTKHDKKSTGERPILIFPGCMPRSLEYLQKSLRDGQSVIGASSLAYDVTRDQYPLWTHLPFITQPEFDEELKQAILKYDVCGIFSPNPVAWDYLNTNMKRIVPGIPLVNDSPVNVELAGYHVARKFARELLAKPIPISSALVSKSEMSEIELASLFRHASLIPGMCDNEKLCALYEIAKYSVSGDIVEIGSCWGKSAFILARLAHSYGVGNLLCVDPWSNEHLIQNDEKGLVDRVSAQADAEGALAVFEMNLIPYSADHVNYLRMPSTDGAKYYREHRSVTTDSFGTTSYRGEIAMLHIDGNHSYIAARDDVEAWAGLVVPGGWIIIDDYNWPYGDGPKRTGNEFLERQNSNIATAFVMGGALFIQLSL